MLISKYVLKFTQFPDILFILPFLGSNVHRFFLAPMPLGDEITIDSSIYSNLVIHYISKPLYFYLFFRCFILLPLIRIYSTFRILYWVTLLVIIFFFFFLPYIKFKLRKILIEPFERGVLSGTFSFKVRRVLALEKPKRTKLPEELCNNRKTRSRFIGKIN